LNILSKNLFPLLSRKLDFIQKDLILCRPKTLFERNERKKNFLMNFFLNKGTKEKYLKKKMKKIDGQRKIIREYFQKLCFVSSKLV